jgi:hypothetical protein
MPWVKVAPAAIKTPAMNIGLRPNLTIKSDAGKVVSIEVINCNDRPSVASHGTGDNRLPTSAVLIMFTFIVVIDNACATDSLITLPVFLFVSITTPLILVTF